MLRSIQIKVARKLLTGRGNLTRSTGHLVMYVVYALISDSRQTGKEYVRRGKNETLQRVFEWIKIYLLSTIINIAKFGFSNKICHFDREDNETVIS